MYNQGWGMMGNYSNVGHMSGAQWATNILPLWIAVLAPWIILFAVWSLVWKGLALWHAARRGEPWWFVILLVVNTASILEIVYLFAVAKLKWGELFSRHDHAHTH